MKLDILYHVKLPSVNLNAYFIFMNYPNLAFKKSFQNLFKYGV